MAALAREIAAQVRSGRMSAVDVVGRALEAAEEGHAQLNSFTLIDRSGALHRAEGVDRLVAAGVDPGPLAGVPIVLKDIIDDAGMPNSRGSSFPSGLANASASVVRRLGAAGAVIIARTGLHEFAFGFTSENPWFGPVRNPWNTATSAGGSSGGSGAAVAAGVVPVGIGTDTGGSVRVPAAMCGVMGLKVTHGRVPLTGVFPLVASLDTVGPIARSVGDLATVYTAMAGDDATDPWSQPHPVDQIAHTTLDGLRIGIVRQWLLPPTSADVSTGLSAFSDACSDLGAAVTEVDDSSLEPIPQLGDAIGPEILAVHGDRYREHPERYGEDVAERIERAERGSANDVLAAERWGSAARATVARLTAESFDVLVSPTVGVLSKRIGEPTVDVDGVSVFHRESMARFTAPINRMRVPALAAPISNTPDPGVSIQLVGPMWSEGRLLGIAAALEAEGVLEVREPPVFFGESR